MQEQTTAKQGFINTYYTFAYLTEISFGGKILADFTFKKIFYNLKLQKSICHLKTNSETCGHSMRLISKKTQTNPRLLMIAVLEAFWCG